MAYGGSQARGQIGAVAASLHHSHSNRGSKPRLRLHHSSRQCQILNPLSKARDQTFVLMDASQIHFCWATKGTPVPFLHLFHHTIFTLVAEGVTLEWVWALVFEVMEDGDSFKSLYLKTGKCPKIHSLPVAKALLWISNSVDNVLLILGKMIPS